MIEIPASAPWCSAPDPAPRPPRLAPPLGACDCHAHICGPLGGLPYDDARIYTPPDALLSTYQAILATLGIHRMVLVQPSVYGSDNRVLLQALGEAGLNARGVAVVAPDIEDIALDMLHASGIRGVRFNCVDRREGRNTIPVAEVTTMARRIARLGWHIEFLLQVDAAPDLSICADLPVETVFGHFGYAHAAPNVMQSPGFMSLLGLLREGRSWVKMTGPYRISGTGLPYAEITPMAHALVDAAPNRLVWGSDWPHVMMKTAMPNDGVLLDLLETWLPDAKLRQRVLVENAVQLYGFGDLGGSLAHHHDPARGGLHDADRHG